MEVCRLPNSLAIYKSKFIGPSGTHGVVRGPSKVVTELIVIKNQYAGGSCQLIMFKLEFYLNQQSNAYQDANRKWLADEDKEKEKIENEIEEKLKLLLRK